MCKVYFMRVTIRNIKISARMYACWEFCFINAITNIKSHTNLTIYRPDYSSVHVLWSLDIIGYYSITYWFSPCSCPSPPAKVHLWIGKQKLQAVSKRRLARIDLDIIQISIQPRMLFSSQFCQNIKKQRIPMQETSQSLSSDQVSIFFPQRHKDG